MSDVKRATSDEIWNFYESLGHIGRGAYGEVYKARDRTTGEIVALKRFDPDVDRYGKPNTNGFGIPINALREIRILSTANHANIVRFVKVMFASCGGIANNIYLAMEYADSDLEYVLRNCQPPLFGVPAKKCLIRQFLEAIRFLHSRNIAHRDIKPSNMLLTKGGVLKLCDFGLARTMSKNSDIVSARGGCFTNTVVTLWYRPPEVILKAKMQDLSLDIWSCGCVMYELMAWNPLFPGTTETQQLKMIVDALGTPRGEIYKDIPIQMQPDGRGEFLDLKLKRVVRDELASRLINRMLMTDPTKRITITEILSDTFFWTDPLPCKPEDIPMIPQRGLKRPMISDPSTQQQQQSSSVVWNVRMGPPDPTRRKI